MAKKALGKGLGALIQKQEASSISTKSQANSGQDGQPGSFDSSVRLVSVDQVVSSPLQPRKQFTEGMLDDLMESIRQHGIIQPLITRQVGDKLELIAGERRLRASLRLGLTEVPVIIREALDKDVLEMALIENLQREDLNPIEEAAGYVRLSKEFKLKQENIAKQVGKSRASIANAMRLLDLSEKAQNFLSQGLLTVGHGKAILAIKDPEAQDSAAETIIRKKLTVRAAEKLAQEFENQGASDKASKPSKNAPSAADQKVIARIQKQLTKDFSTAVNLNHSGKKGSIEIEFKGNEELYRILELLGVSMKKSNLLKD
ncbi:ParB/RepB/Spo0J family partition protein [Rubritalea marina]|uniref:ParB/RepB/Spo0J family partition protein n=1 Tax=Rubritalea marina TaxID=361055 RepID=UPI000362001F|nr:ParB/RepB/Spo0J family partition protein [Rubritalea marina]